MPKLTWDDSGKRLYETGVNQCALYPCTDGTYPTGVAWNGITAITESPSGAEPSPIFADNIKYLSLMSVEEFGGTIEAYTYPVEFEECDGSATLEKGVTIGQQTRKSFGLVYKTLLGNDTDGDSHAYKLHLIYGATASPSEKAYSTINDSPEPIAMSWEFATVPVPVSGFKPTSVITINSATADKAKLAALEKILYGDESGDGPRLPLPDEVKTLMAPAA